VTPRAFPDRIKWRSEKQKQGVWKDVRAVAADAIEIWLDSSPAVALWLARQIGNAVQGGIRDLEDVWQEWSLATTPRMSPELVVAGRSKEAEEIRKWLASRSGLLAVRGDSPDEPFAFLYASIANLPDQEKLAALSRCVVLQNLDEFRAIQAFSGPLRGSGRWGFV
jgi:hypothetical protein